MDIAVGAAAGVFIVSSANVRRGEVSSKFQLIGLLTVTTRGGGASCSVGCGRASPVLVAKSVGMRVRGGALKRES